MEFVQQHWNWLSSNPWGAITLTLLIFGLGWKAAQLYYRERLEILKERSHRDQPSSDEKISYPDFGHHGKNILSNATSNVKRREPVSLRAVIPPKSELTIVLTGPPPKHLSDNDDSWLFDISNKKGWSNSNYDFKNGGKQSFRSDPGSSDMELTFTREGVVIIDAFENGAPKPSWTKQLQVSSSQ